MKKILIKNGHIVNNGKILKKDILISGERIEKISKKILNEENLYKTVDAKGKYILPGLIDDQVHFREPGFPQKGNIASESRAAVAGGVTSYIEMPNTFPQTISLEALDEKFEIASKSSWANYSFMFGGTNENFQILKELDQRKVAGLKLFLGSSTGNMIVDNKEVLRIFFSNTDLPISVHCEDEKTIKKNLNYYQNLYGDNIPISLHPKIRSDEACYSSSSMAINLARETGARLHVFHLSTSRETKLFSNSLHLKDKKITAEVCIHHLWFNDKDYKRLGSKIKWNPAIKTKNDQDSLWRALNDDRIDIIASDHAPHTLKEKNNGYLKSPSGGPLVQHTLLALITCFRKGKITLEKIVEKACHNPAILFKIKDRGFIKENFFADLVIIDLNGTQKVTKENIYYKCGWSPFEEIEFLGKINSTWVNGKCVFENGNFHKKPNSKQLIFNR